MPVQSLLAVFATERYTDWCRRRFGPVVTLEVAGLGPFVAVSDPALIREVFTGDRDVLLGGASNAAIGGSFARSSVVVADGERHLRLRRLLLPPFHGETIRRHEELIRSIAEAEVARWPRGTPVAALPRLQAITLEVILRAVVGVRDERRADELRAVLPGVLGVSLMLLFAEHQHPALFARLGRRLGWLRAREDAERLLDEEIAAHRADPEGGEDVLAMLLAARDEDGRPLDDVEVRDQLLTLLVAGHETTAAMLAWALERLARHPAALARLREEVRAGGGDAYLTAVLDETLRVRPVVDQVGRKLAEPIELGGHRLPAGTIIAPSILGVQRSPEHHPDPAAFRPERFLDAPAPPSTLIPFGGGPRRCIGASFAMLEMRTILRALLTHADLEPTSARDERPTRWRRFTTVPGRGARVVLR